jgi:outer membrane lipase/esterase
MACAIACSARRRRDTEQQHKPVKILLMTTPFLSRIRAALGTAFLLAASAFLASCGSGSTFDPLVPDRIISFGDGLADVGQTGARFTINDGSNNIWAERVALDYSKTLTAAVSGGWGYAQGGARASVATSAPSIEQQITSFLARSAPAAKDLILLDSGISDMAALSEQRRTGALTDAAYAQAAADAARALAAQARRLVAAGAQHVVVISAYNLALSPYGFANSATFNITPAIRAHNDTLKLALADLSANVLLIDAEAFYSISYNQPDLRDTGSGTTVNQAICTVPITSCTPSTLRAGADPNKYLFADDRHFTPIAQRQFGREVYVKIRDRW